MKKIVFILCTLFFKLQAPWDEVGNRKKLLIMREFDFLIGLIDNSTPEERLSIKMRLIRIQKKIRKFFWPMSDLPNFMDEPVRSVRTSLIIQGVLRGIRMGYLSYEGEDLRNIEVLENFWERIPNPKPRLPPHDYTYAQLFSYFDNHPEAVTNVECLFESDEK